MRVSIILSTLIFGLISVGYVLAQYEGSTVINAGAPMVPVSPTQNSDIGVMQPPSSSTVPPPHTDSWKYGWRETWTHEFRPHPAHTITQPQVSGYVYPQSTQNHVYTQPTQNYTYPYNTPNQVRQHHCPTYYYIQPQNRVYWYPSTTRTWGCW